MFKEIQDLEKQINKIKDEVVAVVKEEIKHNKDFRYVATRLGHQKDAKKQLHELDKIDVIEKNNSISLKSTEKTITLLKMADKGTANASSKYGFVEKPSYWVMRLNQKVEKKLREFFR